MTSCGKCKFWDRQNETGGQCWFNPPTPAFAIGIDNDHRFENLRPWTDQSEMCGRGEPK